MTSINLDTIDKNFLVHPYIDFLKVRAHKTGSIYFYLKIDREKRTIKDIVNLAYKFYNSHIDYFYLVSLPYDNIKIEASKLYKNREYVMWKDVVGTCSFKELVTDSHNEKAIELILNYNIKESEL